jgi:hypothetical protein
VIVTGVPPRGRLRPGVHRVHAEVACCDKRYLLE